MEKRELSESEIQELVEKIDKGDASVEEVRIFLELLREGMKETNEILREALRKVKEDSEENKEEEN